MKLSTLKLALASLALTSLVFAGCAADTTAPDAESEDVDVSADELSSRAAKYVGGFSWHGADSSAFVDFQQVTLKSNGKYTATVDSGLVNPAVRCIAFPCTLPESGSWSVVTSGGKEKIKFDPTGPKPSRSYFAEIQPLTRTLTLTRYGKSTNLLSEGSTCANVRCTATTHCEMKSTSTGFSPGCVANPPPPPPAAACAPQGCSGQICADHGVFTTCEFRPAYACYHTATCARQDDGQCGWTPSAALTTCLANANK